MAPQMGPPLTDQRVRMAKILAWIALGFALLSAALILSAPYGFRNGWFDLQTVLMWVVPCGLLAGLAALFVALVRSVVAWRLKTRQGRWMGRAAILIALVAVALPLSELQKGASLPRIHDITTDTADPPIVVAISPLRADAPTGEIYGGEAIARQQQAAYPDIGPIILTVPPDQAFAKAVTAAKTLGWRIVAEVPEAGRIEACATTSWFHLVHDVVIRIRAEGTGARVDVRSVSRLGDGDQGANAERIRAFRALLR
jgi:uncharacterized protein (DUF1499 family)